MSLRNQAKIETLDEVFYLGEITSTDYATIQGITLHSASTRLKRAYRQGLLTREKNGKHYVYSISNKGLGRRDWLKANEAVEDLLENVADKRCSLDLDQSTQQDDTNNLFIRAKNNRCPIVRDSISEDDDFHDDADDEDDDYEDDDCEENDDEEDESESFDFSEIQRCVVEHEEEAQVSDEDILIRFANKRCKVR